MADDVAGSLIEALGNEGEYVDDGRFTLDAAKAQAKLREYQLSDPHGYLLLLVEAAWLASRERGEHRRSRITIDAGPTTTVVFDAISLPKRGLDNLFGVAIGDATGLDGDAVRIRIMQLIGLAANSALALEHRSLTIEVIDEQGLTQRAEVSEEGVEVETLAREPSVTQEVRFVLQGGRVELERPARERELVRARCRYSALEIRVDDERASKGWEADIDGGQGPSGPVVLRGVTIGAAGYSTEFHDPKVYIVNRGVTVETLRPPGNAGLVAVVEVDLPMDLSRSQLQRGRAFEEVERAVEQALRKLPNARMRFNWSAIGTGDTQILVVFAVLAVGFLGLAYLLFMVLSAALS